eukprot:5706952-Prymnesium_polylepis.1
MATLPRLVCRTRWPGWSGPTKRKGQSLRDSDSLKASQWQSATTGATCSPSQRHRFCVFVPDREVLLRLEQERVEMCPLPEGGKSP